MNKILMLVGRALPDASQGTGWRKDSAAAFPALSQWKKYWLCEKKVGWKE